MRKLKLQVQISIDGFIAGANYEMDWLTFNWDDNIKQYVGSITEPIDHIVLGRKLAEGFISHWAAVASDPANPEYEASKKFTETPKLVFSKTVAGNEWKNTSVTRGNIIEEITHLKNQPGNDIMAYGGASFVSSLIKERLIDEFHLFVNPVVLGKGLPIFSSIAEKQHLVLIKSIAFPCGIVVLNYANS
jgi:dihydrofolate reductase